VPYEAVGRYGGKLIGLSLGPNTWNDTAQPRLCYTLTTNNEVSEVLPHIAKDYDFSGDKKIFTFYLRKGMKWSDGAPFTADDYLFWYEDFILNDEVTPVKPKSWSPGGELMVMEKVDDYTVRLRFSQPYPVALNYIAYFGSRQQSFFDPKHYLKNWHIKYNPKAGELAKSEDFDHWWQALNFHRNNNPSQQDMDLPLVRAFIMTKRSPESKTMERNAYYWKIDSAGNQLPYADYLINQIVENQEVLNLKAMAGEASFAGMNTALENYPVYKENEAKGGYNVHLYKNFRGAETAFAFNLTHKDPVLREIFQDVRFRQAMSVAIDREELNTILYHGRAVPRQATVHPSCTYFKEEWAGAYAQHDPEEANALLDEMGLKWDSAKENRLRPDGKPLTVNIEYWEREKAVTRTCELTKEYWEKVGVKVTIKAQQRNFNAERRNANEVDVNVWSLDRCSELRAYIPWTSKFFNLGSEFGVGVAWQDWYDSDGAAGEEPPEKIKSMYAMIEEWTSATNEADYQRLAQELFDFYADNLFIIGTVGLSPRPILAQKNIGNFPKEAFFDADNTFWNTLGIDQWYFRE
jgi:peptide/nickel transport system substrate-binding protein